jgi:hypothetical protein
MSQLHISDWWHAFRIGSSTAAASVRPSRNKPAGFWKHLFAREFPSGGSRPEWPAAKRDELLRRACEAVRSGDFARAKAILESAPAAGTCDAACLNLLGVICEADRDWRQARKHYGKAIRADGEFTPARQNMRRWYELFTFGRTEYPILLGDETPPSALETFLTQAGQNMTPF